MILLPSVRVLRIRSEMLPVLQALDGYVIEVTITGWQDPSYRPDGAHADGRAIDLRTWDQPDADGLATWLRTQLYPLSPHYIVLWGDEGHKDHIHVGYHKEVLA